MLDELVNQGWDVRAINNADLILTSRFADEGESLVEALLSYQLDVEDALVRRGGGLAEHTQDLAAKLNRFGWTKNEITIAEEVSFSQRFETTTTVSTTHEIDHLAENSDGSKLAIEIEWNNKDEFFDRDFQSIRRLHEMHLIELGVIITRGSSLENSLERVIESYFRTNGIHDFADFKGLSERIVDNKGNSRFSFPTRGQRSSIETKLVGGASFTQASASVFVGNKFGSSTTNWAQLERRLDRRNAGRSPVLCLGIPYSVLN